MKVAEVRNRNRFNGNLFPKKRKTRLGKSNRVTPRAVFEFAFSERMELMLFAMALKSKMKENLPMQTNGQNESKFAAAQDPHRRFLTASYELTMAEQEAIFKQLPWCQVIVMPSGQIINRI